MTAYLIVRAKVPESDREAFDNWYKTEHLPDAKRDFKAVTARRGWSGTEPACHLAIYEFPDLATANAIQDSEEIKALVAEFDRCWQCRIKRTREAIEIKQLI